ncbi:hypothetical protein D7X30_08385 [Corallococcus sp. AB011P]|uniref:hypothetical protein n=1 Tax=unclassified Corallococcus TaxID=2685029 RepID=UPI000EA31C9D|nr:MULTISPECIES: hypothetical protein [unclassified Corallococcus]RKG60914.1 hypothetical protein D7X30_08385 [Corallococcus sp. AB011P]RKH81235.1 hypothetical protein D7Y21_30595 [Corallococcus sp. AB045]
MRVITPDLLVAAVTELSRGSKLVRLKDVQAWCEWNGVDAQGDGLRNQALWEAERAEAQGQRRLLKFKSGECKQSRLGWALIPHGTKARELATDLRWCEQSWNGMDWEWVGGVAPVPERRPNRMRNEEQAPASP